jgi:rod shape determining protein RodA
MKNFEFSLDKQKNDYFAWGLFIPAMLLIGIGLLSIFSATRGSNMESNFFRQLISTGIGLAIMFIIIYLPKNLLKYSSLFVYGACLISLVLVLLIGTEIYSTRGWIRLGTLSFQPAEFAKLGIIMALANFISSKGFDVGNIRDFGISFLTVLFPLGLVFLQPDHGTSSVLFAIFIGMLFWAGFNSFILFFILTLPVMVVMALKGMVYFVIGVITASIISFLFRKNIFLTISAIVIFVIVGFMAPMFYNNLMEHQKARIETFLNPEADPRGTGYNVLQSVMAVGSGELTGKGFLQGTQTQLRYIPMQWTDFIFSVPTEEFGFIGGTTVILLYLLLILKSVKIAKETEDKFHSLMCFGIATVFIYHCMINIGMAIGLMPVMGIPLPFMSYGGTYMIINLIFVGILLNTHRQNKIKRLTV